MRVLLADDHALFRKGLANFLTVNDVDVVGLAGDGWEALEKARELRPDIVVMDLQMPRCDWLTATRLIMAEIPETKVIILTVTETDPLLSEALKSGASGYLLKDLDGEEFLRVLRDLYEGRALMPPVGDSGSLGEFREEFDGDVYGFTELSRIREELTDRQIQVLALAAEGKTYKEIGQALNLTERTIKYHMNAITTRLHMEDSRQAIRLAKRAGLTYASTEH